MSGTTVIDLIRHGEPVGGRRYRGQQDDPLSEKGWEQMWQAVGDAAPWQLIVTSPLQRCRAFAQALGARHGIPVAEDARLMEVGFGSWEGRTADELRSADPEQFERFYRDPVNERPPGAEPLEAFAARVASAWLALVEMHAGKHVLVVCHAGVVRAIVSQILDAPLHAMYRIKVDNAGVTRVRAEPDSRPTLMFHGGRLA